ncbi:RNA polymerase sigma factor [Roseiconus lacunae]|uniref:Sigma-70 family RNA polymerase sigma factor n=1 Tax=Roseiconus lacunae TaxID=2605694 RepID=A0ABT7PK50_9BACT|nr:sigma-70 family RNA polymerase sigma factor [Roseiconus lacunae]MCD0459364.1 sigma-70 family RNA polymerase sigma factor [Roseiconus lacunae]MDM4016850.1 sigma-70 family RNA polymerase sigma factor [Roseiconus lacunae]WRQ50840.1 sigma-70 family RNA polymerase sigma factor [Stieleria sp. HD01]
MTDDSASDQDLIDRIKSKDETALATFLQQNHAQLCGFVRSITGEHLLAVTEIDDLVQDIATAAVTSLATAPLDQYSPMDWLQQIARRRVVDAHRFHFDAQRRDANRQQSLNAPSGGGSSGDSPASLEQMLSASMTSPSAVFSRDVRMMRMQEAVASLSEEQQQAIQLRYADGLPTKQIAERLGKTDVAIRVLLSRSMRQLEKVLEDVRPTRN